MRVETGIKTISKESIRVRLLTMASPARAQTSGLNLIRTIISSSCCDKTLTTSQYPLNFDNHHALLLLSGAWSIRLNQVCSVTRSRRPRTISQATAMEETGIHHRLCVPRSHKWTQTRTAAGRIVGGSFAVGCFSRTDPLPSMIRQKRYCLAKAMVRLFENVFRIQG